MTGKIDIAYAATFFHVFERSNQVRLAKGIVRFLRTESPLAVVFGRKGGTKVEGWEKYILDEENFRGMWDEVGEAMETKWSVKVHVKRTEH